MNPQLTPGQLQHLQNKANIWQKSANAMGLNPTPEQWRVYMVYMNRELQALPICMEPHQIIAIISEYIRGNTPAHMRTDTVEDT